MSRFTTHLGLVSLEYSTGRPVLSEDRRALAYLPTPLVWEVGRLGSGALIEVPAFDPSGLTDADLASLATRRPPGVTDRGSIPALGRWVVSPDDESEKAFVLHDGGYASRGENHWHVLGRAATRREIDAELVEAMQALGVPAWKRDVIWSAVRLGGASGWGS